MNEIATTKPGEIIQLSAPERARVESYVDRGGPNDCWEWTGGRNSRGYGAFWLRGRTVAAHRVAMGDPDGSLVCHHCDNPPCVNPTHLYVGTYTDNNRDTVRRGRHACAALRGEESPNARYTAAEIRAMRSMYARGGVTIRTVAKRFGTTKGYMTHILARRCWKHIA